MRAMLEAGKSFSRGIMPEMLISEEEAAWENVLPRENTEEAMRILHVKSCCLLLLVVAKCQTLAHPLNPSLAISILLLETRLKFPLLR